MKLTTAGSKISGLHGKGSGSEQSASCCAAPLRQGEPAAARGGTANIGRADISVACYERAILVPGGKSFVGTNDPHLPQDGEGPEREVTLAPYRIDQTTVTNHEFASFVAATGYVTESERFGWSAVFDNDPAKVLANSRAGSQLPWWHRVEGVSWKHPEGKGSTIDDRLDHPVVQVSWNDAAAYAAWAGGRLPTEAEWEHAARGGSDRRRFPWGDEEPSDTNVYCNIWQGSFPAQDIGTDGYTGTAPARSFAPNPLGLYCMSGNVWEWTRDAFRIRSMSKAASLRNKAARQLSEKVLKGGSYLCHISYCYRYRIAARRAMTPDSAGSNTGFRLVYDLRPRR